MNVLHETAATHECFLPDATPAVIFCELTHESDIWGFWSSARACAPLQKSKKILTMRQRIDMNAHVLVIGVC